MNDNWAFDTLLSGLNNQTSELCRYTLPIEGDVRLETPIHILIDDLFFEFSADEPHLRSVSVTFPVSIPSKSPADGNVHHKPVSSLWIHEPRAGEIEEVALQLASGISLLTQTSIDVLFESRKIEWIRKHGGEKWVSGTQVDLGGANHRTRPSTALPANLLARSVITACLFKAHNPLYTFFKRGAADVNAHRYIEAFYNLFFFLEFEFGNGKSGHKQLISEFLKSDDLLTSIVKVLRERTFSQIVSREFSQEMELASPEDVVKYLVTTRGNLHHPNKRRKENWHPEKQRQFGNQAIFLYLVCLEIATRTYVAHAMSPAVEKACRKVARCLRLGKPIHVVTR